jgi:outer membrane protein insertion porin family
LRRPRPDPDTTTGSKEGRRQETGRSRRGAARAVLAVVVVAAFATVARSQSLLPGELSVVSDVRVTGLRHVSGKEVRAVLKTRLPSAWPWAEKPALRMDFLRADTLAIESVCRRHGFLDARAHAKLAPGRNPREAIVTFEVEEGQRSKIGAVAFTGVESYPADQLRKRLLSRPGRPFNPAFVIADTTRISRAYQDRGYIPHVSGSMVRDGLKANVRYDVQEGPLYHFGDVQVIAPADAHVKESLVRRELLIESGEVYRYPRIERSIERLYETGLFSQVQATASIDSTASIMDIDLRVRERKPRWVDAGIGSGTAERFRSTVEWGHRNVAGAGLQGGLSTVLAFDGRGRFLVSRTEAQLLEPWLFRTRTRGLGTVYYEVRDDRSDPRWVAHLQSRGFSFQLRRELSRFARVSLLNDNTFVDQTFDFLSPDIPESARDSLVPHYVTHRLQLGFDRDLRDNPLDPMRGSAQSVTGEIAGGPLKGTSSFTKGVLVSAWYTPRANGWTIATRIRTGMMSPFGELPPAIFTPDTTLDDQVQRVPLTDRFRTGGVNSIRGYNESSIPTSGGLALIEASIELRVPLPGPFGIEVYADGGNVWLRPSYIKIEQFRPEISNQPLDPGDVRYVVGFGPRLELPVGPLRLDITWGLRPGEGGPPKRVPKVQFAIGPSF